MKAMILAAGLGSRLKPLTDHCPKALLQAGPYTLLEFAIRKLKAAGFDELIINVHHHAPMIISYLERNLNFGCEISISDESDQLLDTGGGIQKASWFFSDGQPFLVYNADIIGDLDLSALYACHLKQQSLATLVVRKRVTNRYLLFGTNSQLCGWENLQTGERRIARASSDPLMQLAFSGIHVINPKIFPLIQTKGRFSIIDTYLALAGSNLITGYLDESQLWADAGKPESLNQAGEIAKLITFSDRNSV
jgi:NDP-sugar pyrophosphorylase family protein